MMANRRMMIMVGLLLSSGVAVGMEEAKALRAERFRKQREAEIAQHEEKTKAEIPQREEKAKAVIAQYEAKAAAGIAERAANATARIRQLKDELKKVEREISAITGGQDYTTRMDDISKLEVQLDQERGALQKAPVGRGQQVAQQDIDYTTDLIADKTKQSGLYLDPLKPLLTRQDRLLEELSQVKRNLADLQVKKMGPNQELGQKIDQTRETRRQKIVQKLASQRDEATQQNLKNTPSRMQQAILAGSIAAVTAGTLYVSLKWLQKKLISRIASQHGRMQDDFSPYQRDMMAAAVLASYRVPGAMYYLRWITGNYDIGSDGVTAPMMWDILAQLYWRKPVDSQMMRTFKTQLIPAGAPAAPTVVR